MAHFVGTETPLGASTTWTSDTAMTNTFDAVKGTIFSDVTGTIYIDQGFRDASGTVNWDVNSSYAVTGGDGAGFSEELVAPLWRIRFVHNSNQTAFRVQAKATATGFDGA